MGNRRDKPKYSTECMRTSVLPSRVARRRGIFPRWSWNSLDTQDIDYMSYVIVYYISPAMYILEVRSKRGVKTVYTLSRWSTRAKVLENVNLREVQVRWIRINQKDAPISTEGTSMNLAWSIIQMVEGCTIFFTIGMLVTEISHSRRKTAIGLLRYTQI